ncbi:MAG TPA: HAD-IIIC family phosphatase [Rhodospirillales bacterium]
MAPVQSTVDLAWLPPAPADFRERCKALMDQAAAGGEAVRRLAQHRLDINQLNRLANVIDGALRAGATLDPLVPVRLGLVGNATTGLLAPALKASAARHGIRLDVIEAPYGQAVQIALDPGSFINAGKPDVVLLAFDHRVVPLPADPASAGAAVEAVAEAVAVIEAVRDGIRRAAGVPVIVQTLAKPPTRLLGSFDRRLPGSPRALIDAVNARLLQSLDGSGDYLLDAAALAESVGLDAWHDETQWHWAKLSFSQDALPLYAEHVARLIAAIRGKSRKCLVMDLDNTLWGGIIGDDGLDGIVVGQGDPVGEAYLEIQRTAKQLAALGVILAVSSKNEDAIARLPFREHADMLLKESDFAAFQANWQDKASNLEAIAGALDIGLDALVLLDDSPAERAQVRDALPAVAVPELPDDPALFPRTLLAGGYFEAVAFTDEDRMRSRDYTARAERIELKGKARDLGEYLGSLDMEIAFARFDPAGRARIAQLINKSNQFNLTTRRYTEAQVAAMENDPSVFTLQMRLKDRFGDNGMIGVVICRIDGDAWDVDTWLMSCRVLGRRVEEAVLDELVRQAARASAVIIRGRYIPTARNALVKDHFKKLGFAPADDKSGKDGETRWRLDVEGYTAANPPMRVVRAFKGDAA